MAGNTAIKAIAEARQVAAMRVKQLRIVKRRVRQRSQWAMLKSH